MNAPQRPLTPSDIIRFVKDYDPDKSRVQLGSIVMGMGRFTASFAAKPEKEKAYIGKRFEKLMASGPIHQRLMSATLWQKLTQAYAPLPRIAKWLCEAPMSLTARMHAFHGFNAVVFDSAGQLSKLQRLKLDRHCRRIYARLFDDASAEFSEALKRLSEVSLHENRVLLCASQFVGLRHAPTAQILSMAQVLIGMGYEVKIINQALVPRRTASGFYFPFTSPKFDKLNDISTLTLQDGSEAQFWQNPHDEILPASFDGFIDAVASFAPAKMISLGPANLYADLAGQYIAHTSMPTTMDIAIGAPGSYGCVRPLNAIQERLMARLGIDGPRIAPFTSGFALPETGAPVERCELGFKDEDYAVAIVSNRINSDMNAEFVDMLDGVLAKNKHLKVRIFGSSASVAPWQKQVFERHPQIAFLGFSDDLYASLAAFDAVLNPPRLGGGTSAAYAMARGLNLFTLDDCDVANVAGKHFIYSSLEAMLEALVHASQTPSNAVTVGQQATQRWTEISDQEAQIQALLDGARTLPL